MNNINTLASLGQSVWLNYLRRAFIESGELSDLIDMGIGGVTSSPAIFERAITCSSDYDKGIETLVAAGKPVQEIYEALVCDDSQRTADRLHPRFEVTEGTDGYVSVELNPRVVHDTTATVAGARHVLAMVDRVNVMIEIPATEAGIEAIRILTADGVNINATHIFSLDTFEKVAQAYLAGLEEYLVTHSVWRMAPSSVGSFSVGRLDQMLDPMLAKRGLGDLQSRIGIACAKAIYQRCQALFSGSDWLKLARHGGRVLRPKWTRTTPHRFELPATWYLDALVGADSIMTVQPAILQPFLGKLEIRPTIQGGKAQAEYELARVAEAGIDLEAIGRQLQETSLAAFDNYFQALIKSVSDKRNHLELGQQRLVSHLQRYGDPGDPIDQAMTRLCDEEVMKRLWAFDTRVSPMLKHPGWLHLAEFMEANISRLNNFAEMVAAEGYRRVLLIGQEPMTKTAEMFAMLLGQPARSFRGQKQYLELEVLEITDHEAAVAAAATQDFQATLVVAISKSGRSPDLLSRVTYLYDRLEGQVGSEKARRSFVAVTDSESDLAEMARNYDFRDCFLNDPRLDDEHVALSFYGLVPSVLAGVPIQPLLDRAQRMVCNASSCNCPERGDNHAAQLGTSLISLADAGRNRLTFITSPGVELFGRWLTNYLLKVSLAHGLPFTTSEMRPGPLQPSKGDELYIALRLVGDDTVQPKIERLLANDQPVIEILLHDTYDVASLIVLWQMALVVADYFVHGGPIEIERKYPAGLVA